MKLRYLATVVALALTTVAALAQSKDTPRLGNTGLYFNPIATRVSNSVADYGPFAFLGQNSTSQVFYGYNMGGFYDFYHAGSVSTGFDVRFADQHANNAMLRDFMMGIRVSGSPFERPIHPYIQASVGYGTTKAPVATVHVTKVTYAVYGGVDYQIARHVDFRVLELGYSPLTTVGSATVGAGGNIAVPSSKLITFSSGLVFRF